MNARDEVCGFLLEAEGAIREYGMRLKFRRVLCRSASARRAGGAPAAASPWRHPVQTTKTMKEVREHRSPSPAAGQK